MKEKFPYAGEVTKNVRLCIHESVLLDYLDLNRGLQGRKCKSYLCAMQPPPSVLDKCTGPA